MSAPAPPWDPREALLGVAASARLEGFSAIAAAIQVLAADVLVNPGGVVRGARDGAASARRSAAEGHLAAALAAGVVGAFERVEGVALSALMARPPADPAAELRVAADYLRERGDAAWSGVVELWAKDVARAPAAIAEAALRGSVSAGELAAALHQHPCAACRTGRTCRSRAGATQAALAYVARVAGDHALRLEVA